MSVDLSQPEILSALSESRSVDFLNPEMEVESRVSTDLNNSSCMSVNQDPNPFLKFTLAEGGGSVIPPLGWLEILSLKQNGENVQSRKKRPFFVKTPESKSKKQKKEEERIWCCERCDEIVEHLQEKIWQLHRRKVEREEMW
jgi:hypothetical protein